MTKIILIAILGFVSCGASMLAVAPTVSDKSEKPTRSKSNITQNDNNKSVNQKIIDKR